MLTYHLSKKSDLGHLLRDTGWPDPARALVLDWTCPSLGPSACTKRRMEMTGRGQGQSLVCVAGRRWLLRGQLWGLCVVWADFFEFDRYLKKSVPHWICCKTIILEGLVRKFLPPPLRWQTASQSEDTLLQWPIQPSRGCKPFTAFHFYGEMKVLFNKALLKPHLEPFPESHPPPVVCEVGIEKKMFCPTESGESCLIHQHMSLK